MLVKRAPGTSIVALNFQMAALVDEGLMEDPGSEEPPRFVLLPTNDSLSSSEQLERDLKLPSPPMLMPARWKMPPALLRMLGPRI